MLGRINTVYRAEPYEPANLVQYLVRRTKIWQFPLVVLYLCIAMNLKNHPNLVLYLVRRTKDVVSVLTLTLFAIYTLSVSTDTQQIGKLSYSHANLFGVCVNTCRAPF